MRLVFLGSLIALSACGPAGFGGDSGDAIQPAGVSEPAGAAKPAAGFQADVAIIPTEEVVAQMSIPEGLSVVSNDDGSITISGVGDVSNAGGRTSGASFLIGGEQETQIAGNFVMVRILAKGAEGTTLNVAYSTNDVGNSGWKEFPLTDSFEEYSFRTRIRQMRNGNNDYLGIVPMRGSVSIAAVGVDIIKAAPAPVEEPTPAPTEEPADDIAPQ